MPRVANHTGTYQPFCSVIAAVLVSPPQSHKEEKQSSFPWLQPADTSQINQPLCECCVARHLYLPPTGESIKAVLYMSKTREVNETVAVTKLPNTQRTQVRFLCFSDSLESHPGDLRVEERVFPTHSVQLRSQVFIPVKSCFLL